MAGDVLDRAGSDEPPCGDPCVDINDQGAIPLAHWVQFEVGYQLRVESGLTLFVGPGLAFLLNPGDCDYYGARCDDVGLPPESPLFTLTASLGYPLAFP